MSEFLGILALTAATYSLIRGVNYKPQPRFGWPAILGAAFARLVISPAIDAALIFIGLRFLGVL